MHIPGKIRRHLTAWRLVVIATLIFALVQDSWIMHDEAAPLRTPANLAIELSGLGLFALAAFFPRVCGTAIILLWFVVSFLPDYVVFFGTFTCGTMMLAYFASRCHYALLAGGLVMVSISDMTSGSFNAGMSAINIIGYLVVSGVGWTLGYYRRGLERAQRETEKIRIQAGMAQAQLRNALAQDLHDSLTADLTRLTLITESLAKNSQMDSGARDTLNLVASQSREALADLRTTIRQLKTSVNEDNSATSLRQILQDSINIARTAEIKLELQYPDDIEERFNRYEKTTLAMLVTEATTNLMKYGKPGTAAELSIEVTGGDIEFMSTNEIGEKRGDYALTSGLGLKQLTAYLVRRGGELEYVASRGMWLVHARIPRTLHQKMLNTPLNQKIEETVVGTGEGIVEGQIEGNLEGIVEERKHEDE